MNQAPHRYDDIIDYPYDGVPGKPHMPREKRAAQFAPFAALTGFAEVIRATAARHRERVEKDHT